jgi:hypothetical protein
MNGYNFTERVRKVLAMARHDVSLLHHMARRAPPRPDAARGAARRISGAAPR